MATADQTTWLDEIIRQRERLKRDLVSRLVGVAMTCVVFAVFLPFWFLFFVFLLIVGSEVMTHRYMTAIETDPTPGRRVAVLASAVIGMSLYSLPALFVWLNDDPLIKFLAVLSLIGALLSISVVRSTHLPFGIASGIPPTLALLWLPLQYVFDPGFNLSAVLALVGVIVLLSYFVSALIQSNRAQSQLLDAISEVREASRAKSAFLSAMSHEVRTPLNAIAGHTDLLLRSDLPAESRQHARAAARAIRLLKSILDDVGDLASVSEGKLRFRPVTAAIRDEMDAVRHLSPASHGEAPPEIRVETTSDVPEFGRFDPILLRKCLGHLCTVVLDDQPQGGERQVFLRCSMAPTRRDRLRISLSGKEPGQRLETPDPVIEGDSLSQSVTRRLAEVMGGKTSVIRAPDGSLSARLELPFVAVADPPAGGAEAIYGRLRVLVVDDIATNRFVVVQHLRALRIEAKEAGSGQEAIERLTEGAFDIVLLDMNMPDMDGEATFREIRASDADWSRIPVIALTADAIADKRDYYLSLGIDGFVSKPVDRRLLWAEILDALPPPPPL
ncbi:MAG: response regulator [Rhodobacteraceae bacterium]|nr:response regulator [Paracoccaceae bacterium]